MGHRQTLRASAGQGSAAGAPTIRRVKGKRSPQLFKSPAEITHHSRPALHNGIPGLTGKSLTSISREVLPMIPLPTQRRITVARAFPQTFAIFLSLPTSSRISPFTTTSPSWRGATISTALAGLGECSATATTGARARRPRRDTLPRDADCPTPSTDIQTESALRRGIRVTHAVERNAVQLCTPTSANSARGSPLAGMALKCGHHRVHFPPCPLFTDVFLVSKIRCC
jgi:hypothetical protein